MARASPAGSRRAAAGGGAAVRTRARRRRRDGARRRRRSARARARRRDSRARARRAAPAARRSARAVAVDGARRACLRPHPRSPLARARSRPLLRGVPQRRASRGGGRRALEPSQRIAAPRCWAAAAETTSRGDGASVRAARHWRVLRAAWRPRRSRALAARSPRKNPRRSCSRAAFVRRAPLRDVAFTRRFNGGGDTAWDGGDGAAASRRGGGVAAAAAAKTGGGDGGGDDEGNVMLGAIWQRPCRAALSSPSARALQVRVPAWWRRRRARARACFGGARGGARRGRNDSCCAAPRAASGAGASLRARRRARAASAESERCALSRYAGGGESMRRAIWPPRLRSLSPDGGGATFEGSATPTSHGGDRGGESSRMRRRPSPGGRDRWRRTRVRVASRWNTAAPSPATVARLAVRRRGAAAAPVRRSREAAERRGARGEVQVEVARRSPSANAAGCAALDGASSCGSERGGQNANATRSAASAPHRSGRGGYTCEARDRAAASENASRRARAGDGGARIRRRQRAAEASSSARRRSRRLQPSVRAREGGAWRACYGVKRRGAAARRARRRACATRRGGARA